MLFRALRKLLYTYVRTRVLPADAAELGVDPGQPVCYVLHRRFLSNLLVLAHESEALGLPPVEGELPLGDYRAPRRFFFLHGTRAWFSGREYGDPPLLARIIATARDNPGFNLQLVPVSILWGRAPQGESSIWRLLFADGWAFRSRLGQLLVVLFHGRNTLVRFGAPLSLRAIVDEGLDAERTQRKISRVLRVHFRHQREMAIGPDLSHRRTQIAAILQAPLVRQAMAARTADGIPRAKAEAEARGYAWEVASDYSYAVVRLMYMFLHWLWNRLYDGVEIGHPETPARVAQHQRIVYVPCHRSHIDYLLLSYVLYGQGLMVPHIAAGANLNMPLIGGLLRRGGAFFLRRSFKDNRLYGAVFNEYLHLMLRRGFPVEYFIEGTRSRTGRLLEPRPGMLAMTLESYLRDFQRPLVFVPVYIGYEKLFEGKSYISELLGQPKKKESLLGLLLTVRELRKRFGKVYLNFAEPIALADVLASHCPDWQALPPLQGERPEWFKAVVLSLGRQIADGINSATVVTPVSLLSLALLATPRHAMDATLLARQLDGYRTLVGQSPYTGRVIVTPMTGLEIIDYCEQLGLLQRQPHPLGDVLCLTPEHAVLLTYARNNILHLFAVPALIACLLTQNPELSRSQLATLLRTLYPFLRGELFLRWRDDELPGVIDGQLASLAALGWIRPSGSDDGWAAPATNSDAFFQLTPLGQAARPTLLRHFITLALLSQRGSGAMTPTELETLCQLMAQRLSLLSEFNAPEFFDRSIFHAFIATLGQCGLAEQAADGRLVFGAALEAAVADARFALPPDVRQTILQWTRSGAEVATAAQSK